MIPAVLPTYNRYELSFARGDGAYLYDSDEPGARRYLDFGAGIAVSALGHCHPHLVKAVTEQAGKIWHCSNLYKIPGQERLAQRLVDAKRFQGGLVFTRRQKIEPDNWLRYEAEDGRWRPGYAITHPFKRIATARAERRELVRADRGPLLPSESEARKSRST